MWPLRSKDAASDPDLCCFYILQAGERYPLIHELIHPIMNLLEQTLNSFPVETLWQFTFLNICLSLFVDFLKYNLWMLGIVAGLIFLLAITLVIKKYRGNTVYRTQSIIFQCLLLCIYSMVMFMFAAKSKRNQENTEEDEEMQSMNSGTVLFVTVLCFLWLSHKKNLWLNRSICHVEVPCHVKTK